MSESPSPSLYLPATSRALGSILFRSYRLLASARIPNSSFCMRRTYSGVYSLRAITPRILHLACILPAKIAVIGPRAVVGWSYDNRVNRLYPMELARKMNGERFSYYSKSLSQHVNAIIASLTTDTGNFISILFIYIRYYGR